MEFNLIQKYHCLIIKIVFNYLKGLKSKHDLFTAETMMYFSEFFVNEAKLSSHSIEDNNILLKHLVKNYDLYKPTF
jgi:hypothetical protein